MKIALKIILKILKKLNNIKIIKNIQNYKKKFSNQIENNYYFDQFPYIKYINKNGKSSYKIINIKLEHKQNIEVTNSKTEINNIGLFSKYFKQLNQLEKKLYELENKKITNHKQNTSKKIKYLDSVNLLISKNTKEFIESNAKIYKIELSQNESENQFDNNYIIKEKESENQFDNNCIIKENKIKNEPLQYDELIFFSKLLFKLIY
ncbi:MAG: hypothetical protein U1E31_00460 [Rickettsiales bacterium]